MQITNNTIVVPVTDIKGLKSKEQLEKLLVSLTGFVNMDIVLCFDGVSKEFINFFQQKYDFFESIINDGNRLNFARNANLGLRRCIEKGHNAILVNQDCVLPSQREIQESLCQFVGVCNPKPTNELPLPKGSGSIEEFNTKFPFYCTFIHLDVLSKIGVLDGVYKAGCEDDDYLIRAKLAGFKTYIADIFVYHEGSYVDGTKQGWESASGAYNQDTLNVAVNKLYNKFQIPQKTPHGEAMQWVLDNHTWKDEMRIE